MTYQEFAAGVPAEGTLVFRSAEENEETMQRLGVNQRVRQLGKGSFRSDLAVYKGRESTLFSDRFSKACSVYLEPPEGMTGFLFPITAGGEFLASGDHVANESLVVFPEGAGSDLMFADLAGTESFTLPSRHFAEMFEVLCPAPKSIPPERLVSMKGNTAEMVAIRGAISQLVSHPECDPGEEDIADAVAAVVAWMGHSSNQWRPEEFNGKGMAGRIAKLAQEYIEEYYREPIRVVDLCRYTRVGVRTLQRCFRAYFNVTTTEYIKMVRFDAARRELVACHLSEGSVTTIALRHGHSHLGRFSVEFRKRYGMSPREALAGRAGR